MKSKLFLGLLFIFVGILIDLESFDVISGFGLNNKVIVLAIFLEVGLLVLAYKRNIIIGGMIILFSGISLLANRYPSANKFIGPGIFVVIGLEIIFGGFFKRKKTASQDFKGAVLRLF